jgi:hypothetical protein
MKHFIRKNLFKGAGGKKPKVEPAVLKPPQLGKFEIANSYSVAEVTDLIGDGPIEGLVNQNGKLLEGSNILQGIYLDNTPIEVTKDFTVNNPDLYLYSNSQTTNGITYFSNLVRNVALTSFDESSLLQKIKTPFYPTAIQIYAPFYTAMAQSKGSNYVINQLFYQNNLNKPAVSIAGDSGFRSLTNNSLIAEDTSDFIGINASNQGTLASYASNAWYITNYSKNSNAVSTNNQAKNQITANTTWEIHYINNGSSQSTLNSVNGIFPEYKTHIQNQINSSNNKVYKEYLNKLLNLANSVEQIKIGKFHDYAAGSYIERFLRGGSRTVAAVGSFLGPTNEALLILKVGEYNTSAATTTIKFDSGPNTRKALTTSTETFKINVQNLSAFPQENIINLLIPKINSDNTLTGEFYGLIVIKIPLEYQEQTKNIDITYKWMYWSFSRLFSEFTKKNLILNIQEDNTTVDNTSARKFNFSNILCEFRKGEEQQLPLNNFNNIHVDYDYNVELYGPFRKNGEVTRINESGLANITEATPIDIYQQSIRRSGGIPTLDETAINKEGSQDSQRYNASNIGYASWNDQYEFNELAIPVVHTIENPNVKQVYFTLAITALRDTLAVAAGSLDVGSQYPAILVVGTEWGKVKNGQYTVAGSKEFTIICQVQGQMLIDFGSPNLTQPSSELYPYIISNNDAFASFILPDFVDGEDPTNTKRYIKVTKVSTETNSVLIKRDVSLAKVTEIIDNNLSYPFSSVAGVKIDARNFSSIPERSYDCRLKKIKVPNNYFPIDGNTQIDKRYITTASTYTNNNQVYIGDWDGGFVERWTDNPAWILYDLLTNSRYGLGSYIDESQVNIWELYKIGRFCDAVDENGYFIGVSDGVGGLEPRYSCNVVFRENIKLFDAINVISNLFRGIVFFANSEIHFLDDRPRTPIAMFSNTNVKNGEFTYNNYRRDQQYNTVEVSYLDRFDNYKTKVEFIEDEIDVRKRGIFKTTINTLGVTSRAMARRVGQHLIYQTLKENQGVEFAAGLETLLCRPGDLILIEDELKTRSTNYGRILSINNSAKTMLIENEYDATDFTGRLTVYTPTGYATYSESDALAQANRSRMQQFALTGTLPWTSPSTLLSGNYYFSGYVTGYPANYAGLANFNYPTQFANYTGKHSLGYDLYAYYNTGLTGWVFSTGRAFTDSNTYNQLITNTGIVSISEVIGALGYKATGYAYDPSTSTRRQAGVSTNISNLFYPTTPETNGILDSEINLTNIPQITTFNVTGYSGGGDNYAYTLYLDSGDININLLPFVAQGSPYRIQRKNAADQIYKVVSIREENQNEYRVVASRYDTGKFAVIEDFSSEDYLPDTYYAGPMTVNSLNVSQLSAPVITTFQTGTTTSTYFNLSGVWSAVTNATGYESLLTNSITQFTSGTIHSSATTSYQWTGLNDIGRWDLSIKALGNKSTAWDSEYAKANTFVVYQTITTYNRAAVLNFTILR